MRGSETLSRTGKFFESLLLGQRGQSGDRYLTTRLAKSLIDFIKINPAEGRVVVTKLLQEVSDLRRKNAELETHALTDCLTGAYNRRYYEGVIEELGHMPLNEQRKPSGHHVLMLIDMDHFKAINDRHGHAAGDAALKHVVGTLQHMVRKTDAVCRVGGDEFAIILKDATSEGAQEKIANITQAFNEMSFDYGGAHIEVRATIAHAEINPDSVQRMEDLLVETDLALFKKKHGRAEGENGAAKSS